MACAGTPRRDKNNSLANSTAQTTSIFPSGMTGGEARTNFDHNMRSYGEPVPHAGGGGGKGCSPMRRNGKSISASTSSLKAKQSHQNKESEQSNLSPVFLQRTGHYGVDGRPSMGTMEKQWEFMRENFINNSNEELEWLMMCKDKKSKGAYKFAHKKNEFAEDKYFKSLCDIDTNETKLKNLTGPKAKFPSIIAAIAKEHAVFKIYPTHAEAEGNILAEQAKLRDFLLEDEQSTSSLFLPDTLKIIKVVADEATAAKKAAMLANGLNTTGIPGLIKSIQSAITSANKTSDEALKMMEKWAKREVETDEYPQILREQEIEWLEKESAANSEALSQMRSYIPARIAEMSVAELIESAKSEGGLISLELALELKNNKLLHWLVTHPEDIAVSNFLTGDKKQFFENLESLDITELRALASWIPEKFELDNDGKKAEWRIRLMTRTKLLVSQFNGDFVKGGWNSLENKRSLVKLPSLKPDQTRRPVYFFRSKEANDAKIKQYDEKNQLLEKKMKWLEDATNVAIDAKKEYDIILTEMRDPDLKAQYGADQFSTVKDMAKSEWQVAENKRKTLSLEVQRLQKLINDNPITREQFIEAIQETSSYLQSKGVTNYDDANQSPYLIEGVFDPAPEINRVERKSTKFVTAEEEAAKRRQELSLLKDRVIMKEVTTEENLAADIAPVVNDLTVTAALVTEVNDVVDTDEAATWRCSGPDETLPVPPPVVTPGRNPARKQSILASANPEMLTCLNKMFSPNPMGGGSSRMSMVTSANRRGSMAGSSISSAPLSSSIVTADIDTGVKEVKKTQSRLLKRLLEPEETSSNDRPKLPFFGGLGGSAGGGGGMSFLDQIKMAKKKSSTTIEENEAPKLTVKPQISFLDAIKGRRVD